jgi:hypothetical protein
MGVAGLWNARAGREGREFCSVWREDSTGAAARRRHKRTPALG